MAPKKNFMTQLQKLSGAVTEYTNIHSTVLSTPSPSLNFLFGNGHGLPRGYSMMMYGPPKGGKSVVCNSFAGQFQRENPDAWVIKFNTEFREKGQTSDAQMSLWGIDPKRYMAFEVNRPDQIFDTMEKDLAAMVDDGMDLGLVIVDSLNGIMGRRTLNADSVMVQQIGDEAKTIQDGLKQILPVQRRCNFGLIATAHLRAEMDQSKVMRGQKVRPAVSYGTQHHCEYFMYVSPNETKDGKTDLLGKSFIDENVADLSGNGEKTGHKIRCKMVDSSLGPKGRSGEFTLDYHRGIISTHEEVFLLGVGYGVIDHPNNVMYGYGGMEWKGKEATLNALENDKSLREKILQDLYLKDMQGAFRQKDKEAAAEVEESVAEE